MTTVRDPSSFSNHDEVLLRHVSLDLSLDFQTRSLNGHVILSLSLLNSSTRFIILDSRDLSISSVERIFPDDPESSVPLGFNLVSEQKHESLGTPLKIDLGENSADQSSEVLILIHYATSPNASAVQWLEPSQTAGGKYPYMFTQCQAIHARSLMPCQDSPGVKFPYSAVLTVPDPLIAVMSAVSVGKNQEFLNKRGEKLCKYSFEQKIPIPSYLLAIAAGNLSCKRFGEKISCAIWSEPEMLEESFNEFSKDTESFILIAESICGPYVWEEYGILVLPPSFPYGGMENPCLTFVTPTLIAGDRSLVGVVAHEIAHSWMGNLVTNATWEHFWMNEGFTVYLERRIIAHYSADKEKMRHLSAKIGFHHLCASVEHFGKSHEYTKLIPKLSGVDPDDAFSSVPYEKGFALLFYLESLVGGPEEMEKYLKAHCEKFKFSTVTSYQFKDFFLDFFQVKRDVLDQVDWNSWFNEPGLPSKPALDNSLSDAAVDLAKKWLNSDSEIEGNSQNISNWATAQKIVLLDEIIANIEGIIQQSKSTTDFVNLKSILTRIQRDYSFEKSKNSEIRFRWLQACLKVHMEECFDDVVEFITQQGRMKFVRPLYRELFRCPTGKKLAQDTFLKHRSFYHGIASKMIAKDLQL